MLPNALARTTVSTNLLAAGLFDVAYGIDVVNGEPFTVRELFIFCAASLAHQGYDPVMSLTNCSMSPTTFPRQH